MVITSNTEACLGPSLENSEIRSSGKVDLDPRGNPKSDTGAARYQGTTPILGKTTMEGSESRKDRLRSKEKFFSERPSLLSVGSDDMGTGSYASSCCEEEYFCDADGEDVSGAIQEYRRLDPILRGAREACFASSLVVCDLTKSPRLCAHFKQYNLSDFFDEHGQRRYQNLSMSFAAKQHGDGSTFGSVTTFHPDVKSPKSAAPMVGTRRARAHRLSIAMVQRDRQHA